MFNIDDDDLLKNSIEEEKETLKDGMNKENNDDDNNTFFSQSTGSSSGSNNRNYSVPPPLNPAELRSSYRDASNIISSNDDGEIMDDNSEWYNDGQESSHADDNVLRPGDHIYVLNGRFGGQTHGIVLSAPDRNKDFSNSCLDEDDEYKEGDYDTLVTVLTFYGNGAASAKGKDYDNSDAAYGNANNQDSIRTNLFNFSWGNSSKSNIEQPVLSNNQKKYYDDEKEADNDVYDDTDEDEDYENSNQKLISDPTDGGTNNVINVEQRGVVKTQTLRQFCGGAANTTTQTNAGGFGAGSSFNSSTSSMGGGGKPNQSKKGKQYFKVRYNASRAKRLLARAGTATCIPADERGLVIARMKHLQQNPQLLPKFHKYVANDECAIVWCCTGRWVTLQAASILELLASSQAASAAVAGGVVSQMSVTYMIPVAPGMVWLWSVPLTVAFPIVIPILIGYGMTSLIPFEILRRCRKKWSQISDTLNRHFWAKASEDPSRIEYFAKNCVTATNKDNKGNFIKTFFGTTGDDDNNNKNGNNISTSVDKNDDDSDDGCMPYMPLNMDGGGGGGDSKETEAVNFNLNAPAMSTGRQKTRSERLLGGLKDTSGRLFTSMKERYWDGNRNGANGNNSVKDSMQNREKQEQIDSLWNQLNGIDLRD